jgi:hypothetical protein
VEKGTTVTLDRGTLVLVELDPTATNNAAYDRALR